MERLLWAYAASTIWPAAMLLCAAFFVPREDDANCWSYVYIDDGQNIEEDDLAFHIAMITTAHM